VQTFGQHAAADQAARWSVFDEIEDSLPAGDIFDVHAAAQDARPAARVAVQKYAAPVGRTGDKFTGNYEPLDEMLPADARLARAKVFGIDPSDVTSSMLAEPEPRSEQEGAYQHDPRAVLRYTLVQYHGGHDPKDPTAVRPPDIDLSFRAHAHPRKRDAVRRGSDAFGDK